MTNMEILELFGEARSKYVVEAQILRDNRNVVGKKHIGARKLWILIAALIVLVAVLVGCAAWLYKLEHLVIIDHTVETVAAASEPERTLDPKDVTIPASTEKKDNPGPYVAQQVLSMQGYEGSPSYNAVQEWLAYETDYVIQHPECRFQDDFHRPDVYEIYPCHTQEMVDKVDEICHQYGLHLMGKGTFLNEESKMEEFGLNNILLPDAITRCFYGYLYEDGSFTAEGELVLPGNNERIVQFQMHNIKKDAFFPVTLGINGMSTYTQWNYRTKDGFQALMALNSTTGFIITENADCFITIIVEEVPDANMVWHGLPEEKAFLEAVCDNFCYSEP